MDKGTHDAETLGNDPLVSVEEAPDPEEDDLDDLDGENNAQTRFVMVTNWH